jgi:PAS domain S-box-containing protein
MQANETAKFSSGRRWVPTLLRYLAPFASTGIAVLIWMLWPVMHQEHFAIFLAAVIVSARFFGFGPAVVCTGLCSLVLDYVIFPPPGIGLSRANAERLAVFIVISLLTAGLARKRKLAERQAGETQQHMAAIVESSEDAILSTTSDGTISSWNPGAELLYGYSEQEALGRHLSFLLPADGSDGINATLAIAREGKYVESFRTEHIRKDGSRVTVLLSISPLRNSKRMVVGCSAIARDVTAQERAAEMLRRNEKLATAGRLASTIAHEINNPLEAITNLLYLARQDGDAHDDYLRLAEQEVQRIGGIAQQTLGLVRENTSAVTLNVAETVEQVLHLYFRKLNGKHIEVVKEYDQSASIRGFSGELRQLFSNLVINAVDAMNDGGKLRIHIQRSHDWADGEQPGVRVTIADTGRGIQRSELSHLFEPFYTTKQDIGTGLGLWISSGIVEKHHGRIRVRSTTAFGRSGTVFSVFLPGAAEEHKAA